MAGPAGDNGRGGSAGSLDPRTCRIGCFSMRFHSTQTVNSSRRHFRSGLKLFFAAAIVWTSSNATAADVYVPFAGEKTTWHEGFDRYDFIMDDATGAITPFKAPASEVTSFGVEAGLKDGKRRAIVVVPKKAAPGN